VGTVPCATRIAAEATINLTPCDRIVEPRRKNGGVKTLDRMGWTFIACIKKADVGASHQRLGVGDERAHGRVQQLW
jgi:hypothetical protein